MNLACTFLESARQYPDRPAIEVLDRTVMYEELAWFSGSLAQAIQDHQIKGHPLVGVLASRSLTAYSAVLAALIAGKGYVPLNLKVPVTRTLKMMSLAGTRLLIVGHEALDQLAPILTGFSEPLCLLLPDTADVEPWRSQFSRHKFIAADQIERSSPLTSAAAVSASDTAYVLFTSGSTGEPKGVPISHGNVIPYLSYLSRAYDFSAEDRFSQSFELTFDLSVHDLFVSWGAGACLCVLPARSVMAPEKFIREKQLTIWFSVPSIAIFMSRMKMLKTNAFPRLRYSLFCGEPLPVHIAETWQAAAPRSQVINLYGPTEATIAILHHRWGESPSEKRSKNGVVAIGRVFESQRACIIDESKNELGAGRAGELCLSGSQVATGYLNNPAKTRTQFVTIPGKGSDIWYRTGDLVEMDSDGCYYYLGRLDSQIKILGHRIELQEIDHAIQQCASTEAAISVAWPVKDKMAQGIVGFVFGDCALEEADILDACAVRLPHYMVPRQICFQSVPPLNANGKIDRNKLAEMLAGKTRG